MSRPISSAFTKFAEDVSDEEKPEINVALQVYHNLQHQHRWKSLKLHKIRDFKANNDDIRNASTFYPLLSGLPPARIYIHPDELKEYVISNNSNEDSTAHNQREAYVGRETESTVSDDVKKNDAKALDRGKDYESAIKGLDNDIDKPQLEWVIPTRISENWTLGRLAAIFDNIDTIPRDNDGSLGSVATDEQWPRIKRAILAVVDDDSTVVYYIVHDGLVKPRQN